MTHIRIEQQPIPQNVNNFIINTDERKSILIAYLFYFTLGTLGVHHLYIGKRVNIAIFLLYMIMIVSDFVIVVSCLVFGLATLGATLPLIVLVCIPVMIHLLLYVADLFLIPCYV